ncbi:hypothetical protein BGZ59_001225, partial [Podila verticillata]
MGALTDNGLWLLMILIVLSLILAIMIGIQKPFQTTRSEAERWTVMFYIFAFIKGSLSILIITLIASGWIFIKPFLNEKDKKIILIIIPLQILTNVAMTISEETAVASPNWAFWGVTLTMGFLVVNCVVVAENKIKYKLWGAFYIVTVVYVYFTRIMIQWKFRPYANNPYTLVDEDDLIQEDIEAGTGGSDAVGLQTMSASSAAPRKAMTREQLKFCSSILRQLKKHQDAPPFLFPVDPVALNIPDYFHFIKRPMDLSTAEKKLNNVEYESADDLASDIQLIVDNCVLYNGKESQISQRAVSLQKAFLNSMRNMPKDNPKPASELVDFREPAKKAPPATKTKKDSSKKEPRKEPMITPIELVTPGATLASSSSIPSYTSNHIRAESEERRPKRDTHAPSKEIPTGTSIKKKGGSRWRSNEQLRFCQTVLKEFSKKSKAEFMFPFMEPVDAIKLNIPEYPLIIKNPMDLSTIRQKLEGDEYNDALQFEADVRLVISNCYAFNPPGSQVHIMGQRMEKLFNEKWAERPAPPTPPMETVDVDSEEMDDDSSDDKIAEMERHLKTLSDKLESMKADKKKDKHGKKSKSSSKHSKSRSEVSVPTSTSSEKKKLKRSRQVISSSEDDGDDYDVVRVKEKPGISLEQQKELSNTINNFTGQELADVIQIIHDSMPHLKNGGQDEIELDMDSLDPTTLRRLYEYVHQNKAKVRKPVPPKVHKAQRSDDIPRKSSDHKPKAQVPIPAKRKSEKISTNASSPPHPSKKAKQETPWLSQPASALETKMSFDVDQDVDATVMMAPKEESEKSLSDSEGVGRKLSDENVRLENMEHWKMFTEGDYSAKPASGSSSKNEEKVDHEWEKYKREQKEKDEREKALLKEQQRRENAAREENERRRQEELRRIQQEEDRKREIAREAYLREQKRAEEIQEKRRQSRERNRLVQETGDPLWEVPFKMAAFEREMAREHQKQANARQAELRKQGMNVDLYESFKNSTQPGIWSLSPSQAPPQPPLPHAAL